MADSLIVRGFAHIEAQTGSDLSRINPPSGKGHFSVPRWWNRGRGAVYVPCVRLDIAGGGSVYISGTRTMKISVIWDGSNLIFNQDNKLCGVERIKVCQDLTSTDYDEYICNSVNKLVKKVVGSGFSQAAPTPAPPAPPASVDVTGVSIAASSNGTQLDDATADTMLIATVAPAGATTPTYQWTITSGTASELSLANDSTSAVTITSTLTLAPSGTTNTYELTCTVSGSNGSSAVGTQNITVVST